MRIAIFTETFLPKIDGISNTLCYLLEHLDARGHASLLFGPAGGPRRYARTPVVGLRGSAFPLYRELRLVPPYVNVTTQLRAFRPDLVHVVNPVSLGIAGLRHARSLRVPVVASYHTDVPGFATRWGFSFLCRPLWSYLKWAHDSADLTLAPSQVTLQELADHGFRRLKVWTRGVDTARFGPQHESREWRCRLSDSNPDSPLLLYVGRLSPEKRVDWLRLVVDALPKVRLAIVGDGPSRAGLERIFAGTRTVFTGFLTGDDLAGAYASADIFTFPAANETLGNVVLEAMASELPVVAPRSGGVLDVADHETTALFFEPESPDSLIMQVERLVADPASARELGRAGRARAETRSWERVLDALLDDYLELIGQGKPETIPWLVGRRSLARDAVRPGE